MNDWHWNTSLVEVALCNAGGFGHSTWKAFHAWNCGRSLGITFSSVLLFYGEEHQLWELHKVCPCPESLKKMF